MSDTLLRTDLSRFPEFERLLDEMEAKGAERALLRGCDRLAIVTLVHRDNELSTDADDTVHAPDPERLFDIFSIGESSEPSDIEHHKDEYIADAIQRRPT